jgi:hypothetical protein
MVHDDSALVLLRIRQMYDGLVVIKREISPRGRHKLILKDEASGDFTDRVVAGGLR